MYTASYNVAIAVDGIMALVPRMTSYICDDAGLSVIIYRPIPEWPQRVRSFRESSHLDGISVRDLLPPSLPLVTSFHINFFLIRFDAADERALYGVIAGFYDVIYRHNARMMLEYVYARSTQC